MQQGTGLDTSPPTGDTFIVAGKASAPGPILLYDGVCGFCNRAVQFTILVDRHARIRFATVQGPFGQAVIARHPELRDVDSLILVENPDTPDERVFIRSDGVLRGSRHVGWPWRVAEALRIIPAFIRDAGYDAFARIRYRVFGRYDTCPIPSAEQRARFID